MVTNQAGVAKGFYGEGAVQHFHAEMAAQLAAHGAHIDDWRYCPHHPEGWVDGYRTDCAWRKPGPGMIRDLLAHWPVEAARSLMIGDKESDIKAAREAGVHPLLLQRSDCLLALVQQSCASIGSTAFIL